MREKELPAAGCQLPEKGNRTNRQIANNAKKEELRDEGRKEGENLIRKVVSEREKGVHTDSLAEMERNG